MYGRTVKLMYKGRFAPNKIFPHLVASLLNWVTIIFLDDIYANHFRTRM